MGAPRPLRSCCYDACNDASHADTLCKSGPAIESRGIRLSKRFET